MKLKNKLKILIVDDSIPDIQRVYEGLEEKGYSNLKIETNPKDTLSTIEKEPIDIILMDTSFSGYSKGYETCKIIKQDPKTKNILVIGLSLDNYEKEWLESGADGFIYKSEDCIIDIDKKIGELLKGV